MQDFNNWLIDREESIEYKQGVNMEKDIKRIENLIKRCNQCKLNECITCDICWSEVQAIENLLKRNKVLKEMYNNTSKRNIELTNLHLNSISQEDLHKERELVRVQTEYDMNEIWKDKIKEKKIQLKETGICRNTDFCNNSCFNYKACGLCDELLEGE